VTANGGAVRHLSGPPRRWSGDLTPDRDDPGVDVGATVRLEFAAGPPVHISVSVMAGLRAPRFRLLGTDGAYPDPDDDPLRLVMPTPPPALLRTDLRDDPRQRSVVRLPDRQGRYYELLVRSQGGCSFIFA
jgi:GFO/IDH/MocA oxidoreductase family protein